MRLFGGDRMDRISSMMQRTDIPDDMPIQAGLVSKAIESAQRQIETMNFAARKYVLEYDDVMNKQRSVIYGERNAILDGKDIHDRVEEMMADVITNGVLEFCSRAGLLGGVGLGRAGAVVPRAHRASTARSRSCAAKSTTRTRPPTR